MQVRYMMHDAMFINRWFWELIADIVETKIEGKADGYI